MSARLAAVLLLVPLAALPFANAAPGPGDLTHVHVKNFAFNPDSVTVLVGETIEWDNQDVASHTVSADDNSFDSGNLGTGATYDHTFADAGTFPYHCDIHPSMVAKVIVVDPNAKPDLVVTQVGTTETVPGVSSSVAFTVRNLGQAAAGASVAGIAYLRDGEPVDIGAVAVPTLGPGETFDGTLTWNTLGKAGDFTLVATADSTGNVTESDETNNAATAAASVVVHGIAGIDILHLLGLA